MPDYFLNFDGSCEPKNPGGWMTWAWVLYDAGGNELHCFVEAKAPDPKNTNNVAEWYALGFGLRSIKELALSVDYLLIRGDSKLVINQLTGEWECKAPHLRKLMFRCHELLGTMKWGTLWVPREQNEAADQLGREKYRERVGRPMPERRKTA